MAFFRRRRTFRRRPLRRLYKKKRVVRRRTSVKAIVAKMLSRNTEKKCRQFEGSPQSLYYPAENALYDSENTIQMSPGTNSGLDISQGTGQGARIGNRIKITNLTFKGIFTPRGYDVNNNQLPEPLLVKLVLFYERASPTTAPQPRTDFFQFNNTTTAIVGDISDAVASINKDTYRVLATKQFKLGFSEYAGDGGSSALQYHSNNDYKLTQTVNWNLTKYVIKRLKYNDNNVDPVNRGLWMQVMVMPADGSVGLTGTIPCQVRYWMDVRYEDA